MPAVSLLLVSALVSASAMKKMRTVMVETA
jgi:hypothetical protein